MRDVAVGKVRLLTSVGGTANRPSGLCRGLVRNGSTFQSSVTTDLLLQFSKHGS